MNTELPQTFDVPEIEAYFKNRLSEKNIENTMRVILNLISGRGVTHKNKPGDAFRLGSPVKPSDDLEKLRADANAWLPCKGPDCLDKGHGWALNHPITKLIEFKNHHLLGIEPPVAVAKKTTKKRTRDPMEKLQELKKLLDNEAITRVEYDEKKTELLAQI